jgi:hypothetical protein
LPVNFRPPHNLVNRNVLKREKSDNVGDALDWRDEFKAVWKRLQALRMPWPEEVSQHPLRDAADISCLNVEPVEIL